MPRGGRVPARLRAGRARGYALIFALLALVAMSLASVVAVENARLMGQREKEAQLLWVGEQYRRALKSYFEYRPGGIPSQYPKTLAELLEDTRGPVLRRHLRRLFDDPFTGEADWVLETEGERIVGIHSRSGLAPVRKVSVGPASPGTGGNAGAGALSYRDWHFRAADASDVPLPLLVETAATPAGAESGGNAPDTGSPPPPQTNPADDARKQCYAQFNPPSVRCQGPNFPYGENRGTCSAIITQLLNECLASQ